MIERKLLIALVMLLAAVSVSAQKIFPSGWDGVVVSVDESPFMFSALMFDPSGEGHNTSIGTAQFVMQDNKGLKFLWLEGVFEKTDAPGKQGVIEKEFEKRMKARK